MALSSVLGNEGVRERVEEEGNFCLGSRVEAARAATLGNVRKAERERWEL